jgi:hypothetical protein
VTTLLTPLPLEAELLLCELVPDDPLVALPLTLEPVLPLEPVVAVVPLLDGVEATVAADDLLAKAGSCPETSTTEINSQAATNSATAPAMTRRRIVRARPIRALLSALPRASASAAAALVSVMSCTSLSVAIGESRSIAMKLRAGPYQPREGRLRGA